MRLSNQMEENQKNIKLRVIIALTGDNFSQAFLLSWTEALYTLINSNRYQIIISNGKSSFVPFARMQTLGLNVLRGKNQKPFEGLDYDIYVTIDSDIIFTPNQLIELIECAQIHPVVGGYYMMQNNSNFATVKEWDTSYFLKNGTFEFLKATDLEPFIKEYQKQLTELQNTTFIPPPQFIKVAYTGLGFFACRKQVFDKLTYPFFNQDLQYLKGEDGKEIIDMCSEDVAFCKNIQAAGFDIMLNTRLRVGHEKRMIL